MSRVVFNDQLDAAECALFMAAVLSVLAYSIKGCISARGIQQPVLSETPFEPLPATAKA